MYVVENGEDFSAKQSEITSLSNSLMLGWSWAWGIPEIWGLGEGDK
jgi:hypothetical protein